MLKKPLCIVPAIVLLFNVALTANSQEVPSTSTARSNQDFHVCSARIPGDYKTRLDSLKKQGQKGMQREMELLRGYAWEKSVLKVAFIGGDEVVRTRIEKTARTWEHYIPVHFEFTSTLEQADIRIGFDPKSGSWSYIGTGARSIPSPKPTMNYGWLTPTTDQTEYDRVVLHEFGHALGAVHEHESPNSPIKWNEREVIAYYKTHDGWKESQVRDNILNRYSSDDVDATPFDPQSIMLYAFPPEFTTDGTTFSWNTHLSDLDIEKMQGVYGKVVQPSARFVMDSNMTILSL
jgi:astacin (peptidase family M12A)